MIQVVTTEHGNIKGYLVDDIFIKKDLLKYFTPQTSLIGNKVIGVSVKEDVKVRTKLYKSINHFLNITDYHKIIRAFTMNGLELNKCLYIKCSCKDLTSISDIWDIFKDMGVKNLPIYLCVSDTGKQLGYMLTTQSIYKSCIVYIHMFEVFEKRQGYGTICIEQLKNLGKTVRGLTIQSSMNFWESLGASFDITRHFSI